MSVAQDSNCTAEPTLELPLDTTVGGNLDVEGTLTVRGVDVSGGGGPTVETVDALNSATVGGGNSGWGTPIGPFVSAAIGGWQWGWVDTWKKSITLTEEKTVMAYYSVSWRCYVHQTQSHVGNWGSLNLLTALYINGGAPGAYMTPIYAAKSFAGNQKYANRPMHKNAGPWDGSDYIYGVSKPDGTFVTPYYMGFGHVFATNSGMWTGTLPAGTYNMRVLYQGYLATAMDGCFNDDSFYMNIVIF